MKRFTIFLLLLALSIPLFSQNKDVLKQFKKDYGYNIFSHKQVFDNQEWALCQFSVVYKLQTSCSTFKNTGEGFFDTDPKVHTKAGAYAILEGVNKKSLDSITQIVAENFINKMKNELGINVAGWGTIKDNPETDNIKDMATDKEILIKKEGIALATTADDGIYYNNFAMYIPGGKKLSKSINKQVVEVRLFIDFAQFVIDVESSVDTKYFPDYKEYTINKSGKSQIIPVVHITPSPAGIPAADLDSRGSVSDIKMGTTSMTAHDAKGYMFYINFATGSSPNLSHLQSTLAFADDIVASKGKIPEVLANSKNKLNDFNFTYEIKTTPKKFGDAVVDATNKYFDDIVTIYKASKP